jgi:hypothetical protein
MGSRGQKKKRLAGSNQDIIICQRRGLLESHGLSESHKQAHQKYLAFIEQMQRCEMPIKETNDFDNIKQET